MRLFQKNIRPAELGSILYEQLRTQMQTPDALSVTSLIGGLDLDLGTLHDQYVGEIMIALIFAGALAAEREASPSAAQLIVASTKAEFLNHLDEQGATPIQKAEWETVMADRFLSYRRSLDGYSGFEPPWKLGRAFFWNLLGEEKYVAMSVKICTLYLMAAQDLCGNLLRELGPRLRMSGTI